MLSFFSIGTRVGLILLLSASEPLNFFLVQNFIRGKPEGKAFDRWKLLGRRRQLEREQHHVNRPVNINTRVNNWQHNSAHRRGVAYDNANVGQRFGNNNIRSGRQARLDFRGRGGQQVPRPGGGGANIADRGGGGGLGNRPNLGGGGTPRNGPNIGQGAGGPLGGGFRGGSGRRSGIRLKHDIALLGRLDSGVGFYGFSYNGSNKACVGVMAQEVQKVMPEAVARGGDSYLRVYYDRLGGTFESYDRWVASGARIPTSRIGHRAAWMQVDGGGRGAHEDSIVGQNNN
jgi:hypothetical protein